MWNYHLNKKFSQAPVQPKLGRVSLSFISSSRPASHCWENKYFPPRVIWVSVCYYAAFSSVFQVISVHFGNISNFGMIWNCNTISVSVRSSNLIIFSVLTFIFITMGDTMKQLGLSLAINYHSNLIMVLVSVYPYRSKSINFILPS